MDKQDEFDFQNKGDTPTLIEVWPIELYLHDERCDVLLREKLELKYHKVSVQEVSF